jgi:nucleoside-diphosphate-sugar epimerase
MRIGVTGADGLVGRHTARVARDLGHDVVAFTRHSRAGSIATGDLASPGAFARALDAGGPLDALVHAAWFTEPTSYLHSDENDVSLRASAEVFGAACDVGVAAIVGVGTCLELGDGDAVRAPQDRPDPKCRYAACKVEASILGRERARRAGSRFAWARLFHVLAADADPRWVVPWAVREALAGRRVVLTDGRQRRDYVHVDDVAAALIQLAEAPADGVFHVCTGDAITLRALLEGLVGPDHASYLGFGDRPRPPGDVDTILGDPTTLRALGWQPRARASAIAEVAAALRGASA